MHARRDPELRAVLGRSATILAEASGPDGLALVGTADRLAARIDGEWRVFGWHEIERGAWRAQSGRMRWVDVEGQAHEVVVDEAGRLPMLFQERVQASTLVTVHLDVEPGEVRLVARRALDGSDDVRFYAAPSGGASLADEPVRALVVAATERIRAEYGL